MKFGGTSVADTATILQAAHIARRFSHECRLVVVVSAMRGVTDTLVEAAKLSALGETQRVADIFNHLRERHRAALDNLLSSPTDRNRIKTKLTSILVEGALRCDRVRQNGNLAPQDLDFISGLGECLTAPLFAAVLRELGVSSEAVPATELIVTDRNFGGAEPNMRLTRKQCLPHLGSLLNRQIVPVVTGFIGATPERIPTTLGRNGSDFSATIVAAAIDADEVIIWTDVNGVMTADPRLVPTARTIAELSYREGSELARLGAKVLHYKTLSVLEFAGTPVWIRSTFAPEMQGTKITPGARVGVGGVALTTLSDISLITLVSLAARASAKTLEAALAATAQETELLFASHCGRTAFAITHSAEATKFRSLITSRLEGTLRSHQFEASCKDELGLVAMVSDNAEARFQISEQVADALENENIDVLFTAETAQGGSSCLLVHKADLSHALITAHGQLHQRQIR